MEIIETGTWIIHMCRTCGYTIQGDRRVPHYCPTSHGKRLQAKPLHPIGKEPAHATP